MVFADLIKRITGGGENPNNVEHEDMLALLKAGTHHVIDVREPAEYAAGHIATAVNHPLSRFDVAALPKGKPLVLVCQAGGRSARALSQVLASGIKDARHYPPVTGGWIARGGAVNR